MCDYRHDYHYQEKIKELTLQLLDKVLHEFYMRGGFNKQLLSHFKQQIGQ